MIVLMRTLFFFAKVFPAGRGRRGLLMDTEGSLGCCLGSTLLFRCMSRAWHLVVRRVAAHTQTFSDFSWSRCPMRSVRK